MARRILRRAYHLSRSRPLLRSSLFGLLGCLLFLHPQTRSIAGTESQNGIEGTITISPVHGGPTRVGVPDSKPFGNATFIVEKESSLVTSFTTDDQGHFSVTLPPGRYSVTLKDRKPKVGRFGPFEVDVTEGQMTKVAWACDSGLR